MDSGIITDSVVFFDNNIIVKEMLYPEFEAILDHVVAIPEYSDEDVHAVFLQINGRLQVEAAVFFLLDFDDNGYADPSWNLPLRHLAEQGRRGPDMGAGPIKLSCRSQCTVAWHQMAMWDPDMGPGATTFQQIANVVKRNRLGLRAAPGTDFEAPQVKNADLNKDKEEIAAIQSEMLQKRFKKELKTRLETQAREHKLRIATMKSEAHDHIDKLHGKYRRKIAELTELIDAGKKQLNDEQQKNKQLKTTIEKQAEQSSADRAQLQKSISDGDNVEKDELNALQEKFELELKTAVDQATTELKERLDMREVELYYRDEQLGRLHEDIISLRKEKQNLIDSGGDRVLKKLADTGITFVAYHPGVDHLTVPIRDIAQYLESPLKYVADKCNVDLTLYKQWKVHYELPVCNHKEKDGSVCAVPVKKVEKPAHFIPGESDRCVKHASNVLSMAEIINIREPK